MIAMIAMFIVYLTLRARFGIEDRSCYIDDDIDLIMNGLYNVGDEFKL